MDIGGTTFTSSLFDVNLKQLTLSKESLVENYDTKTELIGAFISQIQEILHQQNINLNEVMGLSMSCPGPLDSKSGMILETPNLTLLQNTNLSNEMKKKLHVPVCIENDANLFALGEWYNNYKDEDVIVGLTLGSGLGVGVVINGRLFVGAHGMGTEYGISPFEEGVWEDQISIEGIEKMAFKQYSETKSPKELFDLASNRDDDAIAIWEVFGSKLGLCISHLINLLDPAIITMGGGISNAFPYFNDSLFKVIKKYSPSFSYNNINVNVSSNPLASVHFGAALAINQNK